MSVANNGKSSEGKKKRRLLSPEKKFQIFLESQSGKIPVGEILRREGIYSTDLARIRQKAKEGALERLADRPGVYLMKITSSLTIWFGYIRISRP